MKTSHLQSVRASSAPLTQTPDFFNYPNYPASTRETSLMAKIDDKAAETIELRKGTILLITLSIPFLMLVLNYGMNFIEFIRNDESKTQQLQQIKTDVGAQNLRMEKFENKFDKLSDKIDNLILKSATVPAPAHTPKR